MPICEADPWRFQYFEHIPCPPDVRISTEDPDSWEWYPRHRWIYDKLAVALSQGLNAAPHGVMPRAFPVFSKPIMNLRGMGTGSQVIHSAEEYKTKLAAGHFWCTLLTGAHVSSDAALVNGAPRWWRHTSGATAPGGTFDHWTIHAEAMPEIEDWCGAWARRHLAGFTGMVNFETIGGRIIEAHLRFADQWPDLYGAGWVEALIRLHVTGDWDYPDTDRRDGYSVVLFGPHGPHYRHPPPSLVDQVRDMPGVSSVQITFYEERDPRTMPCRRVASGWQLSMHIRCQPGRLHGKYCDTRCFRSNLPHQARSTVPAWWSADLGDFLAHAPEAIVGTLSTRLVETHPLNRATQVQAWRGQIALLREALPGLPANWRLLWNIHFCGYDARIDAVLLTERAILVLEFKVGSGSFAPIDRQQVEDYALDLFDFHAESRVHPVVPILVATHATPHAINWPLLWHGVTPVFDAGAATLCDLLHEIDRRVPAPSRALDPAKWETAPYRPVPTIIEAATMLYGRHGVAEIASARADVGNLTRTAEAIRNTIDLARTTNRHEVVFVTGIPGAGKTLCGLQAVFGADSGAAFLTGNLPLVHVMREALARDARDQGHSIRMARQETESAIQPLIGFLRENLPLTAPPHEHVIVFDEAQRAWDADFGRRKFGHAESEAAMFLDIMQRHPDWAVIVALVGGGQEINTGEAGLAAWGEALLIRPNWRIRAAPGVLTATDTRQRLFAEAPDGLTIDAALHLDVPVRSIRSAYAAPWVDAVLLGDVARARTIANDAGGVPFLVTRSLATLRSVLRRLARGTRRAGLVCSASARRLIADGIWPNFPHLDDSAVANWFLQRWPDVRASDALELPATQFACQGLELDHVGLCWGNDLIRRPDRTDWVVRNFAGTRWQQPRGEATIAYQVNTYRVLLTRARYETVIWVPPGDIADNTRPPADFDAIADFLQACGAQPAEALPTVADETKEPAPMLL